MTRRLKTGLKFIDDGEHSIREGSLCTVIWKADGFGENIGFKLCMSTQGEKTAYYIANVRRPSYIRDRVQDMKEHTEVLLSMEEDIEYNLKVEDLKDSEQLSEITTKLSSKLNENDSVVIDDIREVQNISGVRRLKKMTRKKKTLTYMNLPYVSKEDFGSFERKLLQLSDVVIEVYSADERGPNAGNYLRVKKSRSREMPKSYGINNPIVFREDDRSPL